MKVFQYSISSSLIWCSFDFGTVVANDKDEARAKAIAQLTHDFNVANEALKPFGFTIEFNKDEVEIVEL
jgi:hypothetical protein